MKPVRILHFRPSSFVGGPERQLLRYAQLDQSGSTQTILATLAGEREGRAFLAAAEERGLEALALPAGRLGDCLALPILLRFLKERAISLVCTHGYQADLMGIVVGLAYHIPVACFLRGWTREDWKVGAYEWADRAFLPLATCVVCLSQTQASRLARRRTLRNKVRVVLNVVEVRNVSPEERLQAQQEVRERFGFSRECPVVALAGRLSPEKGAAYLIQAVPRVLNQSRNVRFVIFGDGRLRSHLEEMAGQLGVAEHVTFAGHVPEFPNLLPGIDVLVNCSLTEEMPNVVLEALASAVPVVATDVGSVREIAGDEGALVVVPPADAVAIAGAVAGLLRDPARAQAVGHSGQKRVREAFSPARQSEQLWALYRELIPSLSSAQTTPGFASEAGATDSSGA
jgi:glycosyltransferase involved in cell wall biosynthesis